jgi:hypothetical protein
VGGSDRLLLHSVVFDLELWFFRLQRDFGIFPVKNGRARTTQNF